MKLSGSSHDFGSARDAIDAVSEFESNTTDDFGYDITKIFGFWNVLIRDADSGLFLGWLTPA